MLFEGEDATVRDVRQRGVGFVFQHYALFRHMTVFENVAFGLRVRPRGRRPSEAAIRAKVSDLLKLVQLDWLADRYPSQLSGGQRQRVALARALAVEPQVLLLDEPFGSLDAKVRQELRRWLRRLHDEIRVTSVFVTHDQEEALEVADRVVVMNQGRIEQIGTPQEVFDRPATPFVMGFLGHVNVFHGRVEAGRAHLGPLSVDYPEHADEESRPAQGFARPHELELGRDDGGRRLLGDPAPREPGGGRHQARARGRRGPPGPGRDDARALRRAAAGGGRAPARPAAPGAHLRSASHVARLRALSWRTSCG